MADIRKIFILVAFVANCSIVVGQNAPSTQRTHYVCIMSTDTYHDLSNCASLQMCTGGKIRKTKNVEHLKPCKKCARPVYIPSRFTDIKRILGVKDKKQIIDSLGTAESTIHKNGYWLRISGLPESKTVNMIEFYFNSPIPFSEDSLFTSTFFERLDLQFEGCKSDTVRNTAAHPVTGKIKKDVTIEYRNCAIVERRDNYEDVSKYYYELTFVARENERLIDVEKIQLILKVDTP